MNIGPNGLGKTLRWWWEVRKVRGLEGLTSGLHTWFWGRTFELWKKFACVKNRPAKQWSGLGQWLLSKATEKL